MNRDQFIAKRRSPDRKALLEGSKQRGQLGQAARYELRQLGVANEFEQIKRALLGIDAGERDASVLKAKVRARLAVAGVEFVTDAPVKGGRIDFVVGQAGILIETGGSGMATTQRLKAIDPGHTFGGLVVVGPCGLKGRHPMTPLLVIEPASEVHA